MHLQNTKSATILNPSLAVRTVVALSSLRYILL